MIKEPVKAYVIKADGDVVKVKLLDASLEDKLMHLGFQVENGGVEYYVKTNGNENKAHFFKELNLLGVCFSDGKEWCPAEVFEYLRDMNLISGSFKRISWSGPHDYRLNEV